MPLVCLSHRRTWTGAAVALSLALAAPATAQNFRTQVVVSGLERPIGITDSGSGTLFFTQVPTPGVSGMQGGRNTVNEVSLASGHIAVLSRGEPEPTHLTFNKGVLYWICESAGVILRRLHNGAVSLVLGGLTAPSGIDVDNFGHVYFTQLPTPGVPGTSGGRNTVNVFNGAAIRTLTNGEPEPTDITVAADGTAYWTCKSAGVILRRTPSGTVSPLLTGLESPVGIALDHQDRTLYWTEVPTPGIPGSMGGRNRVRGIELRTMTTFDVNAGDPEPTDVTVTPNGNLYWTCTSAGVIVEAIRVRRG